MLKWGEGTMCYVISAAPIVDAFGSVRYDEIIGRLQREACRSRVVRFASVDALIAFGQTIERESVADRWFKKQLESAKLPRQTWQVIAGTARFNSRTQRYAAERSAGKRER